MLFAQVMDAEEDSGLLGQGQMTVLLSATAIARVPAFSRNRPPALTSTGVTTRATWPLHTQAGAFLTGRPPCGPVSFILDGRMPARCSRTTPPLSSKTVRYTHVLGNTTQDKVAASASLLKDPSKCRGRAEDVS